MNEDAHLSRWLGAHRSAVTGGSPTDHPDVDTLTRHATAQLSPGKARIVSEHLMVCEDGRCVAFVRANAEDVDAAAAVLYPAGELEGMHARTFLCREALWEAFEDMAREQGAPIDDILSEAMRSYARQRSQNQSVSQSQQAPVYEAPAPLAPAPVSAHDYAADDDDELARTGMIRQPTQRMSPPSGAPGARSMGAANPRPTNVSTTRGVAPPHAPPQRVQAPLPEPPSRLGLQRPFTAPLGQQLPAPPPPRGGASPRFPTGGVPYPPPPSRGMGGGMGGGGMPAPPPPRSMPPPLPPSDPMMPAAGYAGSPRGRTATQLTLTYQNRTVEVTKERFLLGRSKTQADLVLDDANVSRQHAAIERVGDAWFLADLGSTNGCYVDGQRVSRRQIADGDVIEITTHQVRCTLR